MSNGGKMRVEKNTVGTCIILVRTPPRQRMFVFMNSNIALDECGSHLWVRTYTYATYKLHIVHRWRC